MLNLKAMVYIIVVTKMECFVIYTRIPDGIGCFCTLFSFQLDKWRPSKIPIREDTVVCHVAGSRIFMVVETTTRNDNASICK